MPWVVSRSPSRRDDARTFFAAAAASNSNAGNAARLSLARLDFGDRPGALIASAWRVDGDGALILDLRNSAPLPATGIAEARVRQANGRIARRQLPLKGTLAPGQTVSLRTGPPFRPPPYARTSPSAWFRRSLRKGERSTSFQDQRQGSR